MCIKVSDASRSSPIRFLRVVLILRRTKEVRSASELVTGNTDPLVNKTQMFGNTSPSAYFKQLIMLSGSHDASSNERIHCSISDCKDLHEGRSSL